MTCSSNTISRPDPPRQRQRIGALLAACGSLCLVLAAPLTAAPGDDAVAEAIAALDRQDGVAAELAGKRALEEGVPREAVAAYIGEGELLQGDLADAREWLGDGAFDAATHDRGYMALARLEIASEDLPAAAHAYDEIIENGEPTARVLVDIGRMRYRAGEHQAALAAAREAISLDRDSPEALEFMAQLTRDAQGPLAALDLFHRAILQAPEDLQLAAQYAATLGDAGQHVQMLSVVREIVKRNPDQPQAYYLQAILAARAGDDDLARALWWRTNDSFNETAAGLLVSGVLEYRSGNPAVAAERFAALTRLQPLNVAAQMLFARALVANGEANVAIPVLQPLAEREDASAYALVLLARAYEHVGRRDAAAPLLERAAALPAPAAGPAPAHWLRDEAGRTRNPNDPVQHLRELVNTSRIGEAQSMVAGIAEEFQGSVDLQMLAGDIALLEGDWTRAMAQYRQVATIRSNWPLVQRIAAIMQVQGDPAAARRLLAQHLQHNPRETAAAALLGRLQRQAGNPARATLLLRHASRIGAGASDPFLLADLAEAEQAAGQAAEARAHAESAIQLAPANRRVAAVLARLQGQSAGD